MTDRGTQLQLTAPKLAPAVAVGDSVAVNGCCLTVSGHRDEQLTFDVLEETLDRTNLKRLQRDSRVNLERALAAGAPFGGHLSRVTSIVARRSFHLTGPEKIIGSR